MAHFETIRYETIYFPAQLKKKHITYIIIIIVMIINRYKIN